LGESNQSNSKYVAAMAIVRFKFAIHAACAVLKILCLQIKLAAPFAEKWICSCCWAARRPRHLLFVT
jgi:hypothetical protein